MSESASETAILRVARFRLRTTSTLPIRRELSARVGLSSDTKNSSRLANASSIGTP